ncbi:hypothetical protein [Kushneria indalinina]|uniref:Lipoprotein n=1 Tax=Kushneria indalinina DSM 14324 TaxID=1122140 RepID=A0A3D9E0B4_9GAMM|nr:hypothetical protein [Kushneria indalinina]REC95979.1 hypothetical protein C8D72_0648 [Kushneria indalinina DSM 14324]
MRAPSSVIRPALACLGMLLLPGLLPACSATQQEGPSERILTVSAGATDEPTARANAMETGQHQCRARGGRQASMVDMEVTPPAMATMDDDSDASSTTDALEAATPEGDIRHVTLTLRCH